MTRNKVIVLLLFVAVFVVGGGCKEDEANRSSSNRDSGGDVSESSGDRISATVTGTINGDQIEPHSVISGVSDFYLFVFTYLETKHTAVAISDSHYNCNSTEIMSGRNLYFDLFQNPSLEDSRVTEPGTFAAWVPDSAGKQNPFVDSKPAPTDTPADNRVIVTYNELTDAGGTGVIASSGSVKVTKVSADKISGTFSVTFVSALSYDGGTVKGSFEAPTCEPWPLQGMSVIP